MDIIYLCAKERIQLYNYFNTIIAINTINTIIKEYNYFQEASLSIVDDMSCPKQCPYANEFYNLQSIGKGAFGFVRIAKRISDNKEVFYDCRDLKIRSISLYHRSLLQIIHLFIYFICIIIQQ